ncbi:MAG TPA: aminopeptidase [Candidatus Paceibacterota bacterium]|nr:aminopeptidase [Candidatus Paceibacterota bacterium]
MLLLALLASLLVVSGCRTLKFYGQAIKGQYQILARQEPIEKLVADPATSPGLKTQLELVLQLRVFAEKELRLPVDGHYREYADLHRPYVVWNVQAAPQFSLEPKTWWYPLVGSLEYRGYFSERDAQDYAAALRKKGFDVFIGSVDAYSTLGWFKDPVLNTFVFRREADLAELIFHELGHQRVFARGDTDFNEAFATVVGEEGARRWLQSQGNTNAYVEYLVSLRRNGQFVRLIMDTRAQLAKIYGDQLDNEGKITAAKQLPQPPAELLAAKRQLFGEVQKRYEELKAGWGGFAGCDGWFKHELNNAQLNTIANYYDFVPGFEALLKLKGGDMEKFYAAAEELSKKSQDERHQWLRDLAAP